MERLIGAVIDKYQCRLPAESSRILSKAAEIAREYGDPCVHASHLALPLLENSIIEQFFQKAGLNLAVARQNTEQVCIHGGMPTEGGTGVSSSLERILEIADHSAGVVNPIKPEDLFLGMVLERGFSSIGLYKEPTRGWRALLLELGIFGTPEVAKVTSGVSRVERIKACQEFDLQVKGLIGVSEQTVALAASRLLKKGEISDARGHGRISARSALEQALDGCLAQNPAAPVTFTGLAREIGISRQRVAQLYPEIAAYKPVPPLVSRTIDRGQGEFDRQVQDLISGGLSIVEIAQQLLVTQQLIRQALSRIRHQATQARDAGIKELRDQGLGEKRIAEVTGIHLGTVGFILRRLTQAGTVERVRKVYRTTQEIDRLKERIVQLRSDPRGLTNRQIAEMTGESLTGVINYTHRLIVEGRIGRRSSSGDERKKAIDLQIIALRRQNLTNQQIADQLGLTINQYNARIRALVASGAIAKRPGGRKTQS